MAHEYLSPFAPSEYPEMPAIAGVEMATAAAGIKYSDRTDVLLMRFAEGTTVGGVFTKSRCASAPVEWCRARSAGGRARALLVNSGNANACTGMTGRQAVERSAASAAAALGCNADDVFLASTGVIGEPLDPAKFDGVLDDCVAQMSGALWLDAARAIMTTDTFPKVATRQVDLGDKVVTINGIAKGAGMIAPDMATMLSFIATDATIDPPVLQRMLALGVIASFNRITVDSDTSTSDTALAFATGRAGAAPLASPADERTTAFKTGLDALLLDLAHQVVKDGEGATKFVAVNVLGAISPASAERVARSVANSPLVKTAIAGEDANWGRVVMAVGKAGEPAERDRLAIWFGDVRVAANGERDPSYSEEAASAVMREREITIRIHLGLGAGQATVWTCDLTQDYVAINGDYRS
jgi:glutamate N-acetyltransferase/amino-acid N-acetyltransferase